MDEGQSEGNLESRENIICQLKTSSSCLVEANINGEVLHAIIDTGADVTLISDEVYNRMSEKPKKIGNVVLRTAGKGMKMEGQIVGPTNIIIGGRTYASNIYVAPLETEMILGRDFFANHKIVIDFGRNKLIMENEEVGFITRKETKQTEVVPVIAVRRITIPPNSVRQIKCKMKESLGSFIVERIHGSKYMVPRSLHSETKHPVVCLVNASNHYVTIKRDQELANATNIDQIMPEYEFTEREVGSIKDEQQIPEHLKELVEKSIQHLNKPEAEKVTQLILDYQDVFAKSDYDLGNFSAVEHSIETGDAPPIKMRMRRTPASFEGEEEELLKKMLKSGVIKPSNSDWCSAPVLIRKKDKSIRWCIDYRSLNAVTKKDVYPLPIVDECLDTLAGNRWFSKLDANSAYWQVKIREEDQKKTAFVTKYGLFEHVRMAF